MKRIEVVIGGPVAGIRDIVATMGVLWLFCGHYVCHKEHCVSNNR